MLSLVLSMAILLKMHRLSKMLVEMSLSCRIIIYVDVQKMHTHHDIIKVYVWPGHWISDFLVFV